jgi:hypothetical protein
MRPRGDHARREGAGGVNEGGTHIHGKAPVGETAGGQDIADFQQKVPRSRVRRRQATI